MIAIHYTYAATTNIGTGSIIASGSLGIGTNSPLVSLDLSKRTDALALPVGTTGQEPSNSFNGMIRYNTTLSDLEAYIGGAWTTLTTGGDSSNYLGTSRLNPNLSASASDTQTGLYTAGTGKVDFTSQGSQVVEISTSGLNVMAGNVGIGTTSPADPLTINTVNSPLTFGSNVGDTIRSGSGSSLWIDTVGSGGTIRIGQSSSPTILLVGKTFIGSANIPIDMLDISGSLAIGTSYAGTTAAPTNGIIVQGNVGIGTTVPNANLEVQGIIMDTRPSGTGPGIFTAHRADTNLGGNIGIGAIQFSADITGTTNVAGASIQSRTDGTWSSSSAPGILQFFTTPNGSLSSNEQMRITSAGLVGIGTTAPSNKLDVSGAQAIGSSYVGSVTAPTNGLAVQGKVGIGTAAPQATLDINGFTKLALNASAPVACSTATDGSIALTHTRNTCVCVGNLSAWTNMVLGNACIW